MNCALISAFARLNQRFTPTIHSNDSLQRFTPTIHSNDSLQRFTPCNHATRTRQMKPQPHPLAAPLLPRKPPQLLACLPIRSLTLPPSFPLLCVPILLYALTAVSFSPALAPGMGIRIRSQSLQTWVRTSSRRRGHTEVIMQRVCSACAARVYARMHALIHCRQCTHACAHTLSTMTSCIHPLPRRSITSLVLCRLPTTARVTLNYE
jgi:hypothetical protein